MQFRPEFFVRLPKSLDRSRCNVSLSAVKISGQWCSNCNGPFDCYALSHIIHQYIRPSLIPKESIIYIGKDVTPIDWNNNNDLRKVKLLAESNYRTIMDGSHQIETINRKIDALLTEKSEIDQQISQLGHDSGYFKKLIEMIEK
jgi:predicted  nucleic acid-binding Zn-ribbon protein